MTKERISVVVASKNPVKLRATEQAFRRALAGRVISVSAAAVASGVSDQPMTDEETLAGARNRAARLQETLPGFDFHVGIEGGVHEWEDRLEAFAWVVVRRGDAEGRSRTCSFELPEQVRRLVHQGEELGHANDIVFGTSNSKHDEGAVGILTGGLINRADLYEPAVVLALMPLIAAETRDEA